MKLKLLLPILVLSINTIYPELKIHKKVLDNGLTILVLPKHDIPQVMLNMVVGVGSKDEQMGEKGIAHLIEHMFFKGTASYSETDIDKIIYKLSGKMNAATSQDWTRYWFNVPSIYWKEILPLMAELMHACSFKDDHIDSEFKVVIQELKMRNDNYNLTLWEELLKIIFPPHPYSHPIIGYKEDIWNLHSQDLRNFYNKHYHPNNAALVIVGDVEPQEVFEACATALGLLSPQLDYKRNSFDFMQDIGSKQVTIYRAVKHPIVANAYCLPRITASTIDLYSLIGNVLGLQSHNRISKKLVDELQLVTSIGFYSGLVDRTLFMIHYEPKNVDNIPVIDQIIQDEIEDIIEHGLSDNDIEHAIKQNRSLHYNNLQDNMNLALNIGKLYSEGIDPEITLHYFDKPIIEDIKKQLIDVLKNHFKPSKRHKGLVLPIAQDDLSEWVSLQKQSDAQDQAILQNRIRTSILEAPKAVEHIKLKELLPFNFAKPETVVLNNKLNVFYHPTNDIPKIELMLSLKVNQLYDPVDKNGLCSFVFSLLDEGTKHYNKEQLMHEFESRGIHLSISQGLIHMSLLSSDLEIALKLLYELITNATFPEHSFDKIRDQLHHQINHFWDSPAAIIRYLAQKHIYKNSLIGNHEATHESIDAIDQNDVINFYQNYFSPCGSRLAIVGDIGNYDIRSLLEKTLGSWSGPVIKDLTIGTVESSPKTTITYSMHRDQVALCLTGNSITHADPDFDKLLLFDQIFGPGLLHSMSHRLFDLRQQTGIFYTPQGSVIHDCSSFPEVPGMIFFGSLISVERLDEAEKLLRNLADTVIDTVTQEELEQAKRTIAYASVNHYSNNAAIAHTFLYLDYLHLPFDYFDNRTKKLASITLEEVKEAVRKILHSSKLSTVKVGRV